MYSQLFRFTDIFIKLVRTHFYIARKVLVGKIVNVYIWAFCSLFVTGYVLQSYGLSSGYGVFQIASVIGTMGLFEVYANSFRCIADIEGDCHMNYLLTLPATPSVIWWSIITSYALVGIILSLVILPLGKILMWNNFSLLNISWIKFIIITVLANIFYGVFTVGVTAYVGSLAKMSNVWSRFIFPLWFLGGFQFSWKSITTLSQPVAYTLLCNPILFVMEGTRAALLGQEGYLQWELCCAAIIGFTAVAWMYGKYKMKKLLDFV